MSSNTETIPFEGLIKDLERIHRREKICKKTINDNIGQIINTLQQTLHTISNTKYMPQNESSQLVSQIKAASDSILPLDEITRAHKEYFAYISKFGKSIDKTFCKDAQQISLNSDIPPDFLNSAISEHYLLAGKFEINELLKSESQEIFDDKFELEMKILHKIISEFNNDNIELALRWAEANDKSIRDLNSDLLYNLHEYKFTLLYKNQGKDAAMKFARENFKKFFPIYGSEIQKLMMSLNPNQNTTIDRNKPENERKEALISELMCTACRIYKTTPKSAMSLIISIGTLALPKFIKYFNLYSSKLKNWTKEDELPVIFEFDKENQYHSIFICPVTKEIITEENPAMMLKCGHIISEHAMKRIAHINNMKIKCPYCPSDNTISTIKKIHFN